MMTTLQDISTIIALLLTAGALFYVARQTQEATKARSLQATVAIFSDFGSDENRMRRFHIYNQLPGKTIEEYSEDDVRNALNVCNSISKVGFMVRYELIERDPTLQFYGYSILECWKILEPFVKLEREKSNNPFHWVAFDYLAREAENYLHREDLKKELDRYLKGDKSSRDLWTN